MSSHSRPTPVLALAAALLLPVLDGPNPVSAQTVVLDEGTFTIFLSGEEVGTETFTIRRRGSGAEATFLANAVVTLEGADGSQMRPTLQTENDLSPVAYENVIEGGDVSSVSIRNMGRRFVARISSSAGDRERELRAEPSARLLDRGVAHQYWFLAGATEREGVTIPVLLPRTGDQISLRVQSVTTEALDVGGQRVQARHVRLAQGSDTRDVWFDDQGRVLRVEIPGEGFRAVRQGG